ncbi:hypothetical protein FA13DRAFT_1706418 [Coprinellus micaceus]|uniref:NYN domain-containing protein n=1 Tax=Coprinellus micaceus TaxID=71717 RepID=A0A4Y7TPN8_COPMI|nr:hypothetical protein FA13DRAFT_1706418 [Coprinellus micaceus]
MSLSQKDIHVDIFWDFGSCPAPINVSGHIVANKIRSLALRLGTIKSFKAYLAVSDHSALSSTGRALALQSEIQSSGRVIDSCTWKKRCCGQDAHCVIMLISGDASFAYALSILRMRNYRNLVLLGPRLEQENASFASQAALCLNWDVEVVDGISPLSAPRRAAEDTRAAGFEQEVKIAGETGGTVPASPPHGVIGDRRPSSFQSVQHTMPLKAFAAPTSSEPVAPHPMSENDSGPAGPGPNAHIAGSEPRASSSPTTNLEEAGTWDDPVWPTRQGSDESLGASTNPSSIKNISSLPPEEEEPSVKTSQAGSISYAEMAKSTDGYFGTSWQWSPGESAGVSSSDDWQTASSKPKNADMTSPTPNFKPLIKVLKECRASGSPKPLWGVVAFEILKKDPNIYEKSGVQKFIQYSELAVAKKIVQGWTTSRQTLQCSGIWVRNIEGSPSTPSKRVSNSGSCPAANGTNPSGFDIVDRIRTLALRFGVIKSFKGYMPNTDLHPIWGASKLRSQLQSSGVSLTDVPGRRDVSDKMVIVDMLGYALDRSPNETVLILITAEPSFSYSLAFLRMRNYRVVLLAPESESTLSLISQTPSCFNWVNQTQPAGPSNDTQSHATPTQSSAGLPEVGKASLQGNQQSPSHFQQSHADDQEEDPVDMAQANIQAATHDRTAEQSPPWYGVSNLPPSPFDENGQHSNAAREAGAISPSGPSTSSDVPAYLFTLVDVLRCFRKNGVLRPLRTTVALEIVRRDKFAYKNAGCATFAQFTSMAEALGFITLGGWTGTAWIALRDPYI